MLLKTHRVTEDIEKPEPSDYELLVGGRSTGTSPVDLKMREGYLRY